MIQLAHMLATCNYDQRWLAISSSPCIAINYPVQKEKLFYIKKDRMNLLEYISAQGLPGSKQQMGCYFCYKLVTR